MRTRLLVLLAVLLTAGFTLGAMPAASAHNVLESTSPSDGSTVENTPARIVLTFNEPAQATGTVIEVDGPSGNVAVGKAKLVNNKVIQQIRPGSPAGKYAVKWRVTSADGHPISGNFSFTSKAPGLGVATASPTTPGADRQEARAPQDEGTNPWPYVALVTVVIIIAGALIATRRQKTRR